MGRVVLGFSVQIFSQYVLHWADEMCFVGRMTSRTEAGIILGA
jgi:hypothetical protein